MGFKEKIMDLFVASEFEDDDEIYNEQDEVNQEYEKSNTSSYSTNEINSSRSTYQQSNKDKYSNTTRSSNSVNFQNNAPLKVRVAKPERFEEVKEIANYLNDKYTVILNLESVGKDLSRRLIDFLSGVAYANNGRIKPVANSTFVITPNNVDVTGDELWQTYESTEDYV